ncbi:MAG: methylenetetrahydrofolate reductase [Clostridia bacterium]|nr:methylenetetrahydrofolate reductase [NAD(P)H] [Clostridia bacterium]MBR3781469.1 methylenetetrahydrofolate reductase [NAD(P)H] [Clostridia bacterium]MBR3818044.1 methylenetetrahydrofolate reductase [NAD(P)H] [Clostridia bacterium]
MKISDILKNDRISLSFEVFPPKTSETYESIKKSALEIAKLSPDFMSVTYGAGGTTGSYTLDVCESIVKTGVTPIAHLTCVCSDKNKIRETLTSFKEKGVENILALRGDLPQGMTEKSLDFTHASDLVEEIKSFGGFCIGGACYPETHPESENSKQDILNLKKKVDSGCEFLTTQMFFDNHILFNYLYKIREAGITVPVIPGIMPVTNAVQIKRICSLSGTILPRKFIRMVDRFGNNPAAMKQAGIAYATEQIVDLYANGIKAVHVYSMNKPDVAEKIQTNLKDIIG